MYFKNFPVISYDLQGTQTYQDLIDISAFASFRSIFIDDYSSYTYYAIKDGEKPEVVSYKLYGNTKYYWTFILLNDHIQNIWSDWPKSQYVMEQYIANHYGSRYIIITNNSLVDKMNPTRLNGTQNTIRGLVSGATGNILEKNTNMGYIEIELTSNKNFNNIETITDADSNIISSHSFVTMDKAPHHYINAEGDIRFYRKSEYTEVSFLDHELYLNNEKNNIRVIKKEYITEVDRLFNKIIGSDSIYV